MARSELAGLVVVARKVSDGIDFGAVTSWGSITGYSPNYPWPLHACRMNGASIVKVADFDGDGKADLLCRVPTDSNPGIQFVSFSTGTTFSGYVFGEIDCPTYGSGPADTNADGREDLICMGTNADPTTGDVRILQSLGSYFFDTGVLASFCSASEFSFGDWNGDGTTDAACANNGRAALRTGNRFVDMGTTTTYCVSGQRLAADLDGDGAAEWICNNPGAPANDIEVRRWNGLAFGAPQTWRGGFCGGLLKAADFNGDGKKDLLCESTNVVAYAGTKDLKADILTSISNGIGGTTTLNWATSTAVAQNMDGSPSTLGLPPKYLVASVGSNDGRTPMTTTSFLYRAGAQDDAERKFFGFGRVVEFLPMNPGETGSPRVIRTFKTDKLLAGRPDAVSRWSGDVAKVLSHTKYEYTTSESTGPGARRTALLSSVEEEKYDGTTSAVCTVWSPCANGRRARREFTYDNYGNVREVKDFGDFDIAGDETFTRHSNAPNPTAYIVGLMSLTQTWQGLTDTGLLLSQVVTSYDGGWWDIPPVKGDRGRVFPWLVEENRYLYSTNDFQHDAYGNLLTTYDATNRSVTYTYDLTYHLYPISATNGAGESTSTTWDYRCGAPLTTTDTNGQVTTLTYDVLCRPTGATAPLGAFESRIYSPLGNANTQYARVEAPGPDGNNDWSEAYFDGFGRTYRSVKRGPSSVQSIVSDVQFDARGNLSAQTAPYYADETPVITTFEYDGFNRRVKTTLPDGNTRLTSYPQMSGDGFFQSTQTNELLQSSATKFDVFGRVKKSEKDTGLHGNLVTTRNYDILGRMTSLVDPVGNTWTYTFVNRPGNLGGSNS